MTFCGILLFVAAAICLYFSTLACGDIGISFAAIAAVAFLAGLGLILGSSNIKTNKKVVERAFTDERRDRP